MKGCGDQNCTGIENEIDYSMNCLLVTCEDGICIEPHEDVASCYSNCVRLEISDTYIFLTPQANIQQEIVTDSGRKKPVINFFYYLTFTYIPLDNLLISK